VMAEKKICDECLCCEIYIWNNDDESTCGGQEKPCFELRLDEDMYKEQKGRRE
jgi:hypothetical protein